MEALTLTPVKKVNGEITLPGSKSLSNRALLLAALANGTTKITNLLDSEDIQHMLNALAQLGVAFTLSEDKTECTVVGNNGLFSHDEKLSLYLGNAGTAMRPLAAALAVSDVNVELTGEPRMKERPIAHLVEALWQLGADVDYLEDKGFPPLKIRGKKVQGSNIKLDGSISSQYLTALLMVCPLLSTDTKIKIEGELVSKPYIDITLDIMSRFGVSVINEDYSVFRIKGQQNYISPGTYMVEGDASSASYFLAAAAIKGGTVTVNGIGSASVQGDKHFADVLESMGAKVEWNETSVSVTRQTLKGVDLDMNHIPDAAMTIAVTAIFAEGPTTIRNVYNWRVKETDRLTAMATELQKLGVTVEEGNDYLTINPQSNLQHAEIETYNDHRVAMCFSLVSLSEQSVTILDPMCVRKTFPDYFEKLATITYQ